MKKYLITYFWERREQCGIDVQTTLSVEDWIKDAEQMERIGQKDTILSIVLLPEKIIEKIGLFY